MLSSSGESTRNVRMSFCRKRPVGSVFSIWLRSTSTMQQHMFTRETRNRMHEIDPYVELRRVLARVKGMSLLDGLLYADIKTYLHALLMKQDQMSMATS